MYLGGLDIGTTGCKISVFSTDGKLFKVYYREYNVTRQSGQHEIDFSIIKDGVLAILKEAANDCRIEALGVTSFGETFAMLDKDDNILLPSMLYTDPRGEEQCKQILEKIGEDDFADIVGVKPNAMYSIFKLMWLKENRPEEFNKCDKVLLGEDFIVYTLTGKRQMSSSLAARTAALDIEAGKWSQKIFNLAGIDPSIMSCPVEAGTLAGVLTDGVKEYLGIDYDIKIVTAAHDQVAGMIGAGIFDSASAMDGTGTVECIPVVLDTKPTDKSIYNGGYSVVPFLNGRYACYAFSFTGGATLKWFRDTFAEAQREECEKNGKNVYALLDNSVPTHPTGLLVLPHFAGAATPYMDNGSKAAILGVTLETTKFDIYKALMEGTSYEMLLNFKSMGECAKGVKTLRATGGGATSDVWLQIKADILQMDIVALDCKEVGAAGCAALAGVAIGAFESLESAAEKMAPERKVFKPNLENAKKYEAIYKRYENLYNSVRGLM